MFNNKDKKRINAARSKRPSVMATPVGRLGSHRYTLPDLGPRPGWSLYTNRQDPVVTVAAGSDTTGAELYMYVLSYPAGLCDGVDKMS